MSSKPSNTLITLVINLKAELVVVVHGPVADGHDAASCGAHENFVCIVGGFNRDNFEVHFKAVDVGGIDDALASDALEHPAVRRVQYVILNEDNVETRALGEVRIAIAQERIRGVAI
ncbi:hypothetical protein NUW58_g10637 [Xylaria curta]|uniref:Uncharacterized protein n=1 Tax=Xylaria curta TaxID=42375 RepID=A0ACC1MIV5_9PEZI|nr:hypothetical protein NUW58_g10637 [Xylaria curta]